MSKNKKGNTEARPLTTHVFARQGRDRKFTLSGDQEELEGTWQELEWGKLGLKCDRVLTQRS